MLQKAESMALFQMAGIRTLVLSGRCLLVSGRSLRCLQHQTRSISQMSDKPKSELPLKRWTEFGRKIIGAGRNYREHAKELNNPVPKEPFVFLKPPTAYLKEGRPITLLPHQTELHHEVELGVVIDRTGYRLSEEQAMECVGGYCLALDMTDRGLQRKMSEQGLPWATAKGFDGSCPVSRLLSTDEIPDPHGVRLWLKVNDKMRQAGSAGDMVWRIPTLLASISQHFTLERGDLILTGTPAGVGPVVRGDVIEAGLDSVVTLRFTVV